MNLNEYQKEVLRTASANKGPAMEMAVSSLGLTGEAGEFADLIKKHVGHGHVLDTAKAAKELGDVLWYVARLAEMIGYDLDTVAQMNVDKLRKRYPNGFSTEASLKRVDVETVEPYSGKVIARTSLPPITDSAFDDPKIVG